ncbi:short-subunit dehydrogenase [Amycolatopsis echigonensis]|uniref:Short-subunit dehydrogenase n=1 Tax=Amycolatopsis echigonensis TaxID=2576905 RepID=A0A2N3WUE9_9PSEU|nr:SDR family NAD(P)-dependent oxidoreductase [Amycolatopsis niigatensis]PKV97492.1 short-subunit dehydrogenase [Amycolatopsis niigatensis]
MTSAPRHCFVTGGSGGLGRPLVREALDRGDYVTRRPGGQNALPASPRLVVERRDLTRPAEVAAVIDRTQRARPVDVVVNNAGSAVVGAAEEMTPGEIRHQIEALLLAPLLITRAFLGPMRERGGRRIIQISSMGGQLGSPAHSAYHAGKRGLEGYTESVSREVADFGIHLTVAQLGGARTGFVPALRYTTETEPCRDNPVGRPRRSLQSLEDSDLPGDPAKIAALRYETTLQPNPSLRLSLGSDTCSAVQRCTHRTAEPP